MAWNVKAPGALDVDRLRTAASLLPRSELAVVHAFVRLTQAPVGRRRRPPALDPVGVDILQRGYLLVAERLVSDDRKPRAPLEREAHWGALRSALRVDEVPWATTSLRIGYQLSAKLLYFGGPQRAPELAAGGGDVPAHVQLPRVFPDDLSTGTSCPGNIDNSCFIDTALVVMFMATDAFDDVMLARSPGDSPTALETFVLGGEAVDFETEWCMGTPAPSEVASILDLARTVAWNMRRGGLRTETVQAVQRLRGALNKCIIADPVEGPLTSRQESARAMYEALIGATGWGRRYLVHQVKIDATVSVETLDLATPKPNTFKIETTFVGGLSTLMRFDEDSGAGAQIELQDLANAALFGTRAESTDAALQGETVDDLLVHAARYGLSDVIQAITQARSESRGVSDVVLRLTNEQTVYLAMHPPSGIMVFEASDLKIDPKPVLVVGETRLRWADQQYVGLDLLGDRRITVRAGVGGRGEAADYRVFAVICKSGEPGAGHYWCYLWSGGEEDDGGVLYRYDDGGQDRALVRVDLGEGAEPVDFVDIGIDQAREEVARLGYFFFTQRVP